MRKEPFQLGRTLLISSLVALVVLSGCGDDGEIVNVVPESRYEIVFGLWLFDAGVVSVVAGVFRLDSSASRADSCTVQVNGEKLPRLAGSNADSSYYQIVLPGFVADATYSFIATLDDRNANAVLTAPSSLATLQITDPPDGLEFSAGDTILVTWDYVGPSYMETEVGLVAGQCPSNNFEHRVLLDGDVRSHTVPSAVTQQLQSCDGGVYVEVIARNTGPVEGTLASSNSTWYVILASETAQMVKVEDSIVIKSVTPNSNLVDGVETDFVVAVDYNLVSADSGEVGIGFNTVSMNRYNMITDAKVLAAKGSGEHVFNVSVVAKDWRPDGEFEVYVNLSEHPHGPIWTPLATDTRVLTFE